VSEDARRLATIFALITLALLAMLFFWRRHETLRPQLLSVDVVFLVEGEQVARQDLPPVEAEKPVWAGALVRFRQGKGAPRILCPFPRVLWQGQELATEPPSAWPSGYGFLKAQWFTLEPSLFGAENVDGSSAEKLAYAEFAAPELGTDLRALVNPEPHNDDFLTQPVPGNTLGGGQWRLKVKVGAYRDPRDLLPWASVSSPGAAQVASVPALARLVPVPAGIHPRVSLAFRCGVFTFAPGVWPEGGPHWPGPATPRQLVQQGLIATPEAVAALAATGDPLATPWEAPVELDWLGKAPVRGGKPLRWGREVAAGDALTWAGRWAVLWSDDGNGLLDAPDQVLLAWLQPPRLLSLEEVSLATQKLSLRRVARGNS